MENFEQMDYEQYKKFFDETPVAFIRTDVKTGEFLMANRCAARLFGFESVEELKEKAKTSDAYPNDERKKLIRILKKQSFVEDYEIRLQFSNKVVYVSAWLHLNCEGTCIEGTLIDITDLVKSRNSQLTVMQEMGKKLDLQIASLAG